MKSEIQKQKGENRRLFQGREERANAMNHYVIARKETRA